MKPSKPPSQSWKTFLRNHAEAIAAIDMCVVPTLTFDFLFAFLVLGHGRRQLLWFEVTRHPTAEWLARQITEAFPWASAPVYLVRDNDRAYGHVFTSRVRAMGIRDRPISPRSPWQNGIAERLIGTLRRECLDQMRRSSAKRICGEFFPPMRHITIKCARTWHYRKMRPCIGRPAIWHHRCHSDLGGAASSICPDMIFGKDRDPVCPHCGGTDAYNCRRFEGCAALPLPGLREGFHHHLRYAIRQSQAPAPGLSRGHRDLLQ